MTAATEDLLDLQVVTRHDVAEGVASLELRRADGRPLPQWTPGAHIEPETRDAQDRLVMRQYSLCGLADARTWRIAVLGDRAGRVGSMWLQRHAHPGARLASRSPRNHFALEVASGPVVLVAGGIGITPIIPMAHALHAGGVPFRLHYHVRRLGSAAFLAELQAAGFAQYLHLSIDAENPFGPQEIFRSADAPAWVYICGPAGFMSAVTSAARACGVNADRIRKELFAADETALAQFEDVARPFTVRIRSTGQEVAVGANQTVVKALEAAGIDVAVSCEQGYCGSCLTGVLDGTPDHRDQFMLPEEHARNDAFTPCCSRSRSSCLLLAL